MHIECMVRRGWLPSVAEAGSFAAASQGKAGTVRTGDERELFHQVLDGPNGAAAPTVVFESGMAASRSFWGLVQPLVARRARAVVYDRSGLGRSPPDGQARTVERMAADLNDLLDALGPGPFILVAHSGGGPIVRAATVVRPERVAGLVLADATDEGCVPIFRRSFRCLEKLAHHASCLLARLGLLEACYRKSLEPLPEDVRRDLHREAFSMDVMRTRGAELSGLVEAMGTWRDASPIMPDIPLTLISGARPDPGMSTRLREAMNAAHRSRAEQSLRGRHVLAHRSGHGLILTEPELVAQEVFRQLEAAGNPSLFSNWSGPT